MSYPCVRIRACIRCVSPGLGKTGPKIPKRNRGFGTIDPQAACTHTPRLTAHEVAGEAGSAVVQTIDAVRRPADRSGTSAQPRGRGVAARRDAALARRDHRRGRGASRGQRLLQAVARSRLRRGHGLYGQGEPADPVTVAEELRRADLLDFVGGRATLLSIQAGTPASANAGHYARIVNELALLRRLIAVAGRHHRDGLRLPDDVIETLDRAESLVFEVAETARLRHDGRHPRRAPGHARQPRGALRRRRPISSACPPGSTRSTRILYGLQP